MKFKTVFLSALLVILSVSAIEAATIRIKSFEDFTVPWGERREICMEIVPDQQWRDNLMIREPVTGIESVVNPVGDWHMGFAVYDGLGTRTIVGFAQNIHRDIPGEEGFMAGKYVETIFDEGGPDENTLFSVGDLPEEIMIVHDVAGNGMGTFDDVTGEWILGSDDFFYSTQDILFGYEGFRGETGLLPVFSLTDTCILPHMVIAPVPEPATLLLLSLGGMLIGKRKNHN